MEEDMDLKINDELLLDKQDNFPPYKCWRPDQDCPFAMSNDDYVKLETMARVLHFEDYKQVFNKSAIIPNPIRDETHSAMPQELKGAWFGITTTVGSELNNWYGNVSCQVAFRNFFKTFRPKSYFIEVVEYRTTSSPRILLTTQGIPEDLNVIEYDPFVRGGPWFIDEMGKHFYLKDIRRYMTHESNKYDAELELLIVLSRQQYQMLYSICDKVAVNHNEANDREKGNRLRKCKKYGSGGRHSDCPSNWNIETCQQHLDKLSKGFDN